MALCYRDMACIFPTLEKNSRVHAGTSNCQSILDLREDEVSQVQQEDPKAYKWPEPFVRKIFFVELKILKRAERRS